MLQYGCSFPAYSIILLPTLRICLEVKLHMGRTKKTVVEYRNYELPVHLPIVVLTGEQWHISHIPSKRLHIHNCLEIGWCHSESGTLIFGDRPVPFHAGDITCIARNVPHTTFSDPGRESLWSYLFLDMQALFAPIFRDRFADSLLLQKMLSSCHLVLPREKYGDIAQLVSAIIQEMTNQHPGYELSVQGLCLSLMICLMRAYNDGANQDAYDQHMYAIAPALDYIQQNYMQDFPLGILADVCHLSPTHFRRLFHEQMGVSPMTFLHQMRILESCSLLRSSGISIAEAAGRVGYGSLSSFNRLFARTIGCTPSAWRKSAGLSPHTTIVNYTGWTKAEKLEEDV